MSLFSQLQQRNVFRAALAYVVAAWLVVQAMDIMTAAFEAPPWVMKLLIGVLALGMIPVLIFSWAYEITPDGIRKDEDGERPPPSAASRRLNIGVILMLAGAISLYVFDPAGMRESSNDTAARPAGPPMVAVLPFTSVSLGGDSDFFASGIHDDLLTQLAKLGSLRVISRTSVLEYRETTKNIRQISEELGADVILEGGVQLAGERIRISAQLIDARNDEHLWAETYESDVSASSIFDTQSEISRAIARALNATLTEQDNEQLKTIPTENIAAYRAYHRAMQMHERDSSLMYSPEYRAALEESIALDPNFTRAWAELVGLLTLQNYYGDDPASTARAEEGLQRLRDIAPASADYLVAQSYYFFYTLKDYDRALQLVARAQAMMPSETQLLGLKRLIQRSLGDFDGAVETIQLATQLDPRSERWGVTLLSALDWVHNYTGMAEIMSQVSLSRRARAYYTILLDLHKSGDFAAYATSLDDEYRTYKRDRFRRKASEAMLIVRNYAAATRLLETPASGVGTSRWQQERLAIRTYWKLGDTDKLAASVETLQQFQQSMADDSEESWRKLLDQGLIEAATGNNSAAIESVTRWLGHASNDPGISGRDRACQTLGMSGAASEAVNCLRDALLRPSGVDPFFDPYLPDYDGIRESPEFVALLSEIENDKLGLR